MVSQSETRPKPQGEVAVVPLDESWTVRWDDFVQSRPDSSFAHLSAWGRTVERSLGHRQHSFLATRDGEVCGILPLFFVNSLLFGRFLVSSPAANSSGVLSADDESRSALLGAAEGLARDLEVDYVELRQHGRGIPGKPADESYITSVVPLNADPELVRKRIGKKLRRDLNRARRDGLSVVYGPELLDDFYSLYTGHMRRLGSPPYGRGFFAAIGDEFGDRADVVVVRQGGRSVAANLAVRHQGCIYNLFAGAEPEAMKSGAITLFCWDQMERGCRTGMSAYDLGRSSRNSNSHHYKQFWQGEDVPLPYSYILHRATQLPDKHATSPRYQAAIKLWQKLPAAITDRVGPHIVKYLH